MIGSFMTLAQTLGVVGGILGKIEKGEDITPSNKEVALYAAQGSMIRLLSSFIIEPTIVISRNLREEEITEKLAEINLDIFASFYIQVFNILTNVYGIKDETAFDVLSSSGSLPVNGNNKFSMMSLEDFQDTINILPIKNNSKEYLSIESRKDAKKTEKHNIKLIPGKGKETLPILPTLIQKEIEITKTVKSDTIKRTGPDGNETEHVMDKEIVIPVLIKATVIYSDFKDIETMISTNDRDKSFSSRLDEYRSGMISMKDLIFADDLISLYKNNKIKDKDDLINHMESRATAANKKLLSTKAIGMNKFYGILIVSKSQLSIIESNLGGKITKPRYKEMLMQQTKSLLINVVDTDWERVEVFTKDLKGTSDLSYKAIKGKKGSNDSSDLAEVFKSISSNRAPAF